MYVRRSEFLVFIKIKETRTSGWTYDGCDPTGRKESEMDRQKKKRSWSKQGI